MGVIFFLIIFSITVALIFLGAFFWAVNSGQFDDQHTPALRVLFEEKNSTKSNNQQHTNKDS